MKQDFIKKKVIQEYCPSHELSSVMWHIILILDCLNHKVYPAQL